jgi:hypothetical protein
MKNKKQTEARYFHYTTKSAISQIVHSGEIKLATAYLITGERPAVWLSTNEEFEMIAQKPELKPAHQLVTGEISLQEYVNNYQLAPIDEYMEKHAARIEVNPKKLKIVNWKRFKKLSYIHPLIYKNLHQDGLNKGANPDEWFAVFNPIYINDWLSVEVYENGEWRELIKLKITA